MFAQQMFNKHPCLLQRMQATNVQQAPLLVARKVQTTDVQQAPLLVARKVQTRVFAQQNKVQTRVFAQQMFNKHPCLLQRMQTRVFAQQNKVQARVLAQQFKGACTTNQTASRGVYTTIQGCSHNRSKEIIFFIFWFCYKNL